MKARTNKMAGKERRSLEALAIAFGRFTEFILLGGMRSKGAQWRVFDPPELSARVDAVAAAFATHRTAAPPSSRKLLASIIVGVQSSIKDDPGDGTSLGILFIDDMARAADLMRFYALEAGSRNEKIWPLTDRRRATEFNESETNREH